MKAFLSKTILSLFSLTFFNVSCRAESVTSENASDKLSTLLETNPSSDRQVLGADPKWYFLRQEIEHLGKGSFWEQENEGATDGVSSPSAVITQYAKELEALEVELLLVPVPAKASLYPEKLLATESKSLPNSGGFIKKLQDLGVTVLDPLPLLQAASSENSSPLYCRSDSHWAPQAGEIIAAAIAQQYANETWAKESKEAYSETPMQRSEEQVLSFVGDLVPEDKKESFSPEELPIRYVSSDTASDSPLEINLHSPVLLVGDSHNLVFNQGAARDMHAQGAGIFDHLSYEFGFPLDRIAVRGSGSSAARGDVARRAFKDKEFLKNKKLLIWLFSAREFTQEMWKVIPAQP